MIHTRVFNLYTWLCGNCIYFAADRLHVKYSKYHLSKLGTIGWNLSTWIEFWDFPVKFSFLIYRIYSADWLVLEWQNLVPLIPNLTFILMKFSSWLYLKMKVWFDIKMTVKFGIKGTHYPEISVWSRLIVQNITFLPTTANMAFKA